MSPQAVGELGGDIKELLRAKTSSDKVAEVLEVKVEAIGSKVDEVAAALGSKVDKVAESMTGRFDDLGNIVGDLDSRILRLEWQVGVILAIIGVFLTDMVVPVSFLVYVNQPLQRLHLFSFRQSSIG